MVVDKVMAKNTASTFAVLLLTAFCCLKSASNAQTAQNISEVIALLNSFSLPLNLTMARTFLTKVHDSEIGLCLNLMNNKTGYRTSITDASLASLHVRLINYSIRKSVLQFPCLHCPNLTSSSPTAEFVLSNETLRNVTCLAASRFVDDYQITVQNPLRLSDVLSLSLVSTSHRNFANISAGETVYLEMPLTRLPNNSRGYKLKCQVRPLGALQWSSSFCTTNQTLKLVNQTRFVQCNCSLLGYFAVFVDYFNQNGSGAWNYNGGNFGGNLGGISGGGNPAPITGPYARLSLKLDADCDLYLSNSSIKADFLNSTKYSIALAVNTSVNNIVNMEASCGSIFVNFTLLSPDATNGTLSNELVEFSNLIQSDLYKVPVGDTKILPLTLQISASYNLTIPTSIVSKYYLRLTATAPTTKTTEIQPLVVDYTPFVISVAVLFAVVVSCICGTCCAHSWYLRKKKYTEFNSDKVKPKIQEPVIEEEEVAPPEFAMTFTERQKVDERAMARYDWARTSFAPEQTDTSAFLTSAAVQGQKLILDCESDDESESSLPPGDVAINMEEESETSETSRGSEEGSSEEEDDDVPGNNVCEGSIQEMEENDSRASLVRLEDEIVHEATEEQEREHGSEEAQENEGSEDHELENEPTGEGKHTGEKGDSEDDQDGRQGGEESPNDEDPRHDERDNDVTLNDVKQGGVTHDDVTQDDVRQDEDEDDNGTDEDSENASERAPSRCQDPCSRMDGAVTTNGGMPEPCM